MVGVCAISFSAGAKSADDVPLIVKRGDLVSCKVTEVRDAIPVKLLRLDSATTTELRPSLFGFPDIAASLAGDKHCFILLAL